MTENTKKYLLMIGKTDDSSLILTKGFTKQADELKRLGLATYIHIARGGCYVALTQEGVDEYERLTENN